MNKNTQDDIEDQIDDYILGLLSDEKHKEISALIANNIDYNKYFLQQKELIEIIQKDEAPDPGPEYWENFADQVLERCHQETKPKSGFLKNCTDWWETLSIKTSFFQPAMAFAVVLAVLVVLINPFNQLETQQYDPLVMQEMLWQKTLPNNDMLNALKPKKNNTYAFSNADSINAFVAGKNLTLSMAYFKDKDYVQSEKILESLKGMSDTKALYSLINNLKKDGPPSSDIAISYKNLLTQIEKQFSTDNYNLFITGSWLAYLEMAMVSKQYHLFAKFNRSQYILQKLKSQSLPASIYSHLQQLDKLLKKDQFNRKELTEIKVHISDIQNVLG